MSATQQLLRFGVFELNLATEELRKGGTNVKLPPQPFRLLVLLVSRAGQVVTREEIKKQLWGDETYVDFEHGVNKCIRQIRTALNDNAEEPVYLETLPRHGYCFLAPVVTKTVPGPALKVTPSASGIQSGIPTLIATQPSAPPNANAAVTPVAAAAAPAAEIAPTGRAGSRLLIIRIAGVLLVVGVLIGGALAYRFWHGARTETQPTGSLTNRPAKVMPRRRVAVLGFQNLSGHPGEDWRSISLSTMLNTELAAGDQLLTVPEEIVTQMKIDLPLKDADSYGPKTLDRVRNYLKTDDVVVGSFTPLGKGDIRLDLRLQDAATGETIAAISEKGGETKMDELAIRAGAELRRKLGVSAISDVESAVVRSSMPTNVEAARLYSEGLGKLRVFNWNMARDLLEKAVAAEPGYAPAHSALAEAWKNLGHDKEASEEAKQAFEHSGSLSAQDKLLVEARYREIKHQWNDAIELYRALWQEAPDNVEYGLWLASAQTKASKGNDALVTVKKLRMLPSPIRDDARIDLAEAHAADSLGDLNLQEAAATRAAKKAEALDSHLLLAKARTAQGKALFYREDYSGALQRFNEALAIYQESGDTTEETTSLTNVASVLLEQGDLAQAQAMYRRALEIYNRIGDKNSAALTLNNMGVAYQGQEHLAAAGKSYSQALEIYREVDDKANQANILNNIAEVLYLEGDLVPAKKTYEQALKMDATSGDRLAQSEALFGLGQVLVAEGDLAGTRARHGKVLELAEPGLASKSRLALAELSLEEGHAAAAEAASREAAEEFRKAESTDEEARAQEGRAQDLLARALLAQGKLPEAAQVIAQATTLTKQSQDRRLKLSIVITSARIRAASDRKADEAAAIESLRRTLAEATEAHLIAVQYEAALALGEIELKAGQLGAGRARLQALEREAGKRGFGLVAGKAAQARQQQASGT